MDICEGSVEGMERQTLMETWATFMANRQDKPIEEGTLNPQIEEQRLAFEREKWLAECEDRKRRVGTRLLGGRNGWLRGTEKIRSKMLLQKQEKRELEKANLEVNRQWIKEDNVTGLKNFSEALKGAIPRQTNDPLETEWYFFV